MDIALWSVIGFISGAVPWSVILGRLFLRTDIRGFGDNNPGATNVGRAGGNKTLVVAAVLLDGFKAAIPIGIAYWLVGISGWGLVLVSIAPVLGHAYSPFLGFKGGKAVASIFGVWCGLTLAPGPTILGLLLGLIYSVFGNNGWAMLTTMLLFGGFVLPYYGDPIFGIIWGLCVLQVLWRYRDDLRASRPFIRPKVLNWVRERVKTRYN